MIEFPEFVLRTLFAGACGLLVGVDREVKNKPLGAQAYLSVALASSALMVVTLNFSLGTAGNDVGLVMDPTRLIQGIVGGIGFLGAGAIMTKDESGSLRGVASGAAIWGVGAIGVACGLGYLKEAAFISALIFAILNLHGWVQGLFEKSGISRSDEDHSSTQDP